MTAKLSRSWIWRAGAAGVAGALVLLYFFPPAQHAFYPRCLLHSLTGLSCPGCGSLRAIHRLLHGDLVEAFWLNPLLLIALPVLAGALLIDWGRRRSGSVGIDLQTYVRHPAWVWSLVTVVVGFGVLRNVPWHRLLHLE